MISSDKKQNQHQGQDDCRPCATFKKIIISIDRGHKPDSVSRKTGLVIHLSDLPETASRSFDPDRSGPPHAVSYLILLRAGFTMRFSFLSTRWSLTPPFHPYPENRGGMFSVALSISFTFVKNFPDTGTPCPVESGLSSPAIHCRSDQSPLPIDKVSIAVFHRNRKSPCCYPSVWPYG